VAPDGFDFAHTVGGIDDFFTNLKHSDLLAANRTHAAFQTAADIELATGEQKYGVYFLRSMGRISEI
jgi:hypothetical protein